MNKSYMTVFLIAAAFALPNVHAASGLTIGQFTNTKNAAVVEVVEGPCVVVYGGFGFGGKDKSELCVKVIKPDAESGLKPEFIFFGGNGSAPIYKGTITSGYKFASATLTIISNEEFKIEAKNPISGEIEVKTYTRPKPE